MSVHITKAYPHSLRGEAVLPNADYGTLLSESNI